MRADAREVCALIGWGNALSALRTGTQILGYLRQRAEHAEFLFEALANFLIRRGQRVSICDQYERGYSDRAKCCQDARFFA